MKNLNELSLRSLSKIFLSLFLLLPLSCKDNIQDELTGTDPASYQGEEAWQDLLEDLPLEKSVIVQQNSSIQEAINAAIPGEVIYIEPGVYKEALTIVKDNIQLIGLEGASGEKVILENPGGADKGILVSKQVNGVGVSNIQLQKFKDNRINISSQVAHNSARRKGYFKMKREQLDNKVAHYEFEVRLGKREFDVVRIHRVVREYRPYRPVHTKGEVFMVHGGWQDFDDIFLTAGSDDKNAQTSSPAYLAANGIDVWGIDLAWTLVPPETTDFEFMKDWGVERDVDHTLAAMSIARLIRGLTGQGFGKLNLLGFSYGVGVAYGAAGRETRQHPIFRDIKGIIPVDGVFKYDPADENFRLSACAEADGYKAAIDMNNYQNGTGAFLTNFGNLAISDAGGDSPLIPGFTNAQAARFVGVNNAGPDTGTAPYWHFIGGDFNNLLYTDANRWFQLLSSLAPFQPQRTLYEYRACACTDEEVSIDDYLDQISVPILYIGAAGGLGSYGTYTSDNLTASTDVTTHIASAEVPVPRALEYGHADLFMGNDADNLVWEELRQWLVGHHGYYL